MAEKRNIFLVGPMGAGKSTIGRQLAQQLNMEFYDSDQEIEKRTGADVGWVFDVLEALADERNPLYEEIADVTIRTDDQSAKVVANQIIHMLESN